MTDMNRLEAFAERAAIMEYEGGLSRQEAEHRAFRLTWPEGSCTMVGEPKIVEEALHHARLVFGESCRIVPVEGSHG